MQICIDTFFKKTVKSSRQLYVPSGSFLVSKFCFLLATDLAAMFVHLLAKAERKSY